MIGNREFQFILMELGILRKKISNCESKLSSRESSWQISKWVRTIRFMKWSILKEIIWPVFRGVKHGTSACGRFWGVSVLERLSSMSSSEVVWRNPPLDKNVRGSNFQWTRFPVSNVCYTVWSILFSLFPIQYMNSMFLRNKENKFEEWATRNAESAIDWTSTCC